MRIRVLEESLAKATRAIDRSKKVQEVHQLIKENSFLQEKLAFQARRTAAHVDFLSLLFSVADPGSGAFLTPGSGMGKKSGPGSGMSNQDHISESLETVFWVKILKFFDAEPGSVF